MGRKSYICILLVSKFKTSVQLLKLHETLLRTEHKNNPYTALKIEVLVVLFVSIIPARQSKTDYFGDSLSVLQNLSDKTCHCGQCQKQETGPS